MDYLHESGVSIYRRRRQRRAVATFAVVVALLLGTLVYAASYVQGWVGAPAPKVVGNAACSSTTLVPREVTVNVYNATPHTGLAAAVARLLEVQGFRIATIDNDPMGKSLDNVGEIRHGQSGTAAAILVKKRLPKARLVNDGRMDASVDVVLGKAYKVLQVPPKVTVLKGTVTPGC